MDWTWDQSIALKNKITHVFIHFVVPDNVLSIIQSKMGSWKVLTDMDISKIRAKSMSEGRMGGAMQLLDCLCVYHPKWFDFLVEVLRDEDVKLNHLAAQFEKDKDEILFTDEIVKTVALNTHAGQTNAGMYLKNDSTSPSDTYPSSKTGQQSNTVPKQVDDTADDFSLDGDDAVISDHEDMEDDGCYSNLITSDMPKVHGNKAEEQGEVDEECTELKELALNAPPRPSSSQSTKQELEVIRHPPKDLYDEPTDPSTGTPYYVNIALAAGACAKSETYCESEDGYTTIDDGTNEGYEEPVPVDPKARSSAAKVQSRMRRSKKYDFSYGETESALSEFEGWHPQMNDKQVMTRFKKILEFGYDGHYLLWYWEKKKRPAVCVSHNSKLITFVIHRKPDKESSTRQSYYIEKKVTKATLYDIFMYHHKNGIPLLQSEGGTTTTINLSTPIKPQ